MMPLLNVGFNIKEVAKVIINVTIKAAILVAFYTHCYCYRYI